MQRQTYERPSIVRHQMGFMNKFGKLDAVKAQTHIDGVAIHELVEQFGSPLFVFSEKTIAARVRELRDAFVRRYPRVRIAWSYKTNYLDAVCRTMHREGSWAEVVSPFEYQKALKLNVSPDHIHWNGPFKPDGALSLAIAGGSFIHVDSLDEIARVERLSEALGVKAKLAIRVNMAIEGLQAWSRFGLNLENGQAREGICRVVGSDHLELVGLHTHIGTFILDPAAYGTAARKLAELANDIWRDHGIALSFLDLGGGFASQNTLKGTYLVGEQASPSFARYADAICEGLMALEMPPKEFPTLVLETGRALVDESGYLVSTVVGTKRMPQGERALVVDAGVNLLFTSFWYQHEMVPAQESRGLPEATTVFGPLCMNIDVLRDSVKLPPLSTGDRVVIRNVGAYNVTQWMQFITTRPAVVMVGRGGDVALIRRAEGVGDLTELETVPSWLAP